MNFKPFIKLKYVEDYLRSIILVAVVVTACSEENIKTITPDVPVESGKYNEAPMLAKLVREGKLPPVEERLPEKPVVVTPVRSVGKYGGTGYGVAISPQASCDVQMMNEISLFDYSNDLSEMYPSLATHYEFNSNYTSCTIYLRKGVKWSDGVPFTADDIVFHWRDVGSNPDYNPVLFGHWQLGVLGIEKIDNYAVRFNFAFPMPSFQLIHGTSPPIRAWLPKHAVSHYLPKYNPDAQKDAEAEGFSSWQQRFTLIDRSYGVPKVGVPVLNPWILVKDTPTQQIWERNPYYFEVDTESNQLPYIDRWVVDYIEDMEIVNLKAISGDISIAGLNLKLINYPLLKEYERIGEYHVVRTYQEEGADVGLAFNQHHPDAYLRTLFQDVRFRRAMSLAIDRDEINELVYLGAGTPRQATINSRTSFFQNEWAETYAQYDPVKADSLLRDIGLQKGEGGFYHKPNGEVLTFMLEYPPQEGPKKEVCELVGKYWGNLGVNVLVQGREKTYLRTRVNTNEQDVSAWHVNRELERAKWTQGWYGSKLGVGGSDVLTYANVWKTWLLTGGEKGVKPSPEAMQLYDAFVEWQRYPFGSEKYIEAGVRVHDLTAEHLFVIGTVGEVAYPVIVSDKLENVFSDEVLNGSEEWIFGAASWFLWTLRAEQFYFKKPEDRTSWSVPE